MPAPPAAPISRAPATQTKTVPAPVAPEPATQQLDRVEYAFTDPDRIQKLTSALGDLDAWTQKRAGEMGVVGLLTGVVIDQRVVKLSAAGFQNYAEKTPVTADSVFRIGSITKPVTAMAILKLRDAGKLRLDAAAADYLPELSSVRAPTEDAKPLTVRDLLLHTSGLPREGATEGDAEGAGISEAALLRALKGMQLEFEPGSRYQYSNLGFSLLGLIVARVSGLSYRQYLAKHIFEPLGLRSAVWDADAVQAGRLALPHRRGEDGQFVVDVTPSVFGAREPSGGLYISGHDLGRFLAWQLSAHPPGARVDAAVMRPSTLRESHRPARFTGFFLHPAPERSRWLVNAEASFLGFSWHGYQNCEYDPVIFHNGLVHTYSSDAAFLPQYGVGVFALSNSMPADVSGLRRELLERLRLSGGLRPREKRATSAPRLELALTRLLEVYNRWDPEKYDAMLSERHKQNITQEREREEFDEYRELHGSCRQGPMLSYVSQNQARYLLECDQARLEMALYLHPDTGLIDGFVGHSTGVEPMAQAKLAADKAVKLLNRYSVEQARALFVPEFGGLADVERLATGLKSVAPCKLGSLVERDGNRRQRFQLKCETGPAHVLTIHLSDTDRSRLDGFLLEPVRSGPCVER